MKHQPSFVMHRRESGRGPAMLFIHGWMVSGRVWDRVLPLLHDFRCVVPDLRGSGQSSPASGSVRLEDYLDDLVTLCQRLDLRHTHLVGHSMGGQLAALLAARMPERFATLTLLTPVPVAGLALPDEAQPLFRNCGGDRDGLGRILAMASPGLDALGREQLLDDAMRIAPAVISTGFEAWRRGMPHASLETATMPATVIATDDPFLPAAFLESAVVATLPNARLAHLPRAGHYPQLERPRETAALLRAVQE